MPASGSETTVAILKCARCGWETRAELAVWQCAECAGPLAWVGPSAFSRTHLDQSEQSLWRYAAALPAVERRISLGEPQTPLVPALLDGVDLVFKLDSLMPTGSYKDRGASVLLSYLASAGATRAVEDSSGNAAAAIAAYAARAGMECTVFAPATASAAKLVQAAAFGAQVERVEGPRDAVALAAIEAAADDPDATYASHNWHPFFIEGVKTWALELWEQLGFDIPGAVVVPVGAGSLLLGAHRAFTMLLNGGEIDRLPRLYAAQPAACAPLHRAFQEGLSNVPAVEQQPTIAEGTAIRQPIRGPELLAALRESRGGSAAVDEGEIIDSLKEMASQGFFIEPTSAVAVAGARKLLASGVIKLGERTVVLLSGNGLKASTIIAQLLEGAGS